MDYAPLFTFSGRILQLCQCVVSSILVNPLLGRWGRDVHYI